MKPPQRTEAERIAGSNCLAAFQHPNGRRVTGWPEARRHQAAPPSRTFYSIGEVLLSQEQTDER